jgi:hypothetical protein
MSEKVAVAFTGRRPIWDNECQANRTWLLRVRQHADGRAIYGVYATHFQNGQTAVAGNRRWPRLPGLHHQGGLDGPSRSHQRQVVHLHLI